MTKDDVRHWFNMGRGEVEITLVIDGLPPDLQELLELSKSGSFNCVLGLGSEIHRTQSVVPGRTKRTTLGRVPAVELMPLDSEEFSAAEGIFDELFAACFHRGAHQVAEFRWPRALRVCAATLTRSGSGRALGVTAVEVPLSDRVVRTMLPAIPGSRFLAVCSQAFGSEPVMQADLDMLASAFLHETEEHSGAPEWLAVTWGRPAIRSSRLESELGAPRVERLRAQGMLSLCDLGVGPIGVVRVEELLAHHVVWRWASELGHAHQINELDAMLDRLLRLSSVMPLGELSLAAAIEEAGSNNGYLAGRAINYLVARPPEVSRAKEGAVVQLLVKDRSIRLHFGEGMDEEFVGEVQPWLVLSHLCFWPMDVDACHSSVNFSLFAVLARSKQIIQNPPPRDLADAMHFHVHEVNGIGVIPCMNSGIVEPLLQAMVNGTYRRPEELVSLAEFALEEKDVRLAWRVLSVARFCEDCTVPKVAEACNTVRELLWDWWGAAIDAAAEETGGA